MTIPSNVREHLIALKLANISWKNILIQVNSRFHSNYSERSLKRIWSEYQNTGRISPKPKSGRKSKLSKSEQRLLVLLATRDRRASYSELRGTLDSSYDINVSKSTVRRTLLKHRIFRRLAKICPLLTHKQRYKRVLWAYRFALWSSIE